LEPLQGLDYFTQTPGWVWAFWITVALVIIVAFGVAAPRMRHDDPSRPPATCEDPRTGLEYDC
jgi:hypothetical protein